MKIRSKVFSTMEVEMQIILTDAILKAIAKHVHEARTTRGILDVYKAAEIIRLENIADNVAREDIIEQLIHLSGLEYVPVEFNRHAFESEGADLISTNFVSSGDFTDAIHENESVH